MDRAPDLPPELAPQLDTVPVTLLTGFLGSGKTTLLRRALTDPEFSDTAVVINEIGEIAIDHYLVDVVDGNVLELPGGCLCCAVREDLARTLRDLIERRDAGTIRRFRRLVVETSGLADPAPILYTLGTDPLLDQRLRLARVVTMVDAVSGASTLERFAEATRQAAVADVLVVSKTDLSPFEDALSTRLADLNPGAERIVGAMAADPAMALFGARQSPHPNPPPPAGEGVHRAVEGAVRDGQLPASVVENSTITSAQTAPSPASGGGLGWGLAAASTDTLHAHHSHGIATFTLILDGEIGRFDFARALGGLAQERGNDLLRVKGLVRFADRPDRPAVIQAAQHSIFSPEWLDTWPDADQRSRLVFIVHDIAPEEILDRFDFALPSLASPIAARPLETALHNHI